MKHHPDMGGDTRTMQEINAEHDRVFKIFKDRQNREAQDPTSETKPTTETPEEFRAIVEALLKIQGIEIELCGAWLWIGGDTYPVKDDLKAAGCLFSRSKKKWYWRHAEDGATWSRGKTSMAEIRSKYGSSWIKGEREEREALPA